MRRRRLPEAADSLELTVGCLWDNFGNIILIALLVTLLARDSKTADTTTQAAAGDLTQRRQTQAEKTLAYAMNIQRDLAAQSSDPSLRARMQWVEQRAALRQETDRLQRRLQLLQAALTTNAATTREQILDQFRQSQAELDAAQKQLAEERNRTAPLEAGLAQQRQVLEETEQRVARTLEQRVRRLRLPREHESTKRHLYIIVRYNQFYPLYQFTDGLIERNTNTVAWEQVSANVRKADAIRERGLDITREPAKVVSFLRTIPREDYYPAFLVYEDSFGSFNTAKESAVAERLEYAWEPMKTNDSLTLGPGGHAPPPQ